MLTDQQLHVLIEEYARAKTGNKVSVGDESDGHATSYLAFVEDYRKIKLIAAEVNAKVEGMGAYIKERLVPNLNLAYDQIETEVGFERLSNPKTNYCINGGFRQWSAAVDLPTGWTATNAPTITRVTGWSLPPATTQGGNYGVKIASGGSAGSIYRTARVKGGSIYRLAGWVNVESGGSFTVTVLDNGTGATALSFTRTAAQIGAVGWFSFPRAFYDALSIQTTADATSVTITLESTTANKYATFSDIQLVQGPNADPDLWEPAPEDIETAPGVANSSTYTPTATGVLNITTVTPGTFWYTQVGSVVWVAGTVTVDPVAAGATTYRLSIPVASNFGGTTEATGTTVHGQVAGLCGEVQSVAATDDVLVGFLGPDGTQRTYSVTFSYRVI